MKASVDISMYPLDENYGTAILQFLKRIKKHEGLTLKTNTMSTQIFGEYDHLMKVLTNEMKTAFEDDKAVVMVMKIVNLDLSPSS